MKKKVKLYYIGLIKANNSVKISITKLGIAQFLGISVDTITRHMDKAKMYTTDNYIIWRRIPIEKIKRGWTYNQGVTKSY